MPAASLQPTEVEVLLKRLGFGAQREENERWAGRSAESVVEELLAVETPPVVAPPELSDDLEPWRKIEMLRHWWYDRMAFDGDPLREKTVLFLHGHFTTEFAKVGSAVQMWDQNNLFRSGAFADFRQLVHDVAVQPAMLHYLDNASNVVGKPNENFARELWELFLVGPGQYTESDVRESARAWSGHTTELAGGDPDSAAYRFAADKHDSGCKTIFGRKAAFDGPDVIDWTFEHKGSAVARFVCNRLWRFLTGASLSRDDLDTVAISFARRWQLGDALRSMVADANLLDVAIAAPQPRSPTEVIVAAMRGTGLRASELNPVWFSGRMGQELFSPPGVTGWEGGDTWLSATGFFGTARFAGHAAWLAETNDGLLGETADLDVPAAVAIAFERFGVRPGPATRLAVENWLAAERSAGGWATARHLIMLVLLSPEFQVA